MKAQRMRSFASRATHSQVSRWLAWLLLASSAALSAAVVLARSPMPRPAAVAQTSADPVAPMNPGAATNPASPTAPPALTPDTRPPADPRTPVELARDATIAERVKTALAADHVTRMQPIDIEVTRGITNLSGMVSSQSVAQRALSIARSTGGVTAVQDAMKVEGEIPGVR